MKNPNGYGTVFKLSGNRRNPFVARKTKGWDDKGHPIYDVIGYYPTREEGMIALAEYNRDPYDVNRARVTLKELFDLYEEKKGPSLNPSSFSSLKSAIKHCEKYHNTKYRQLKSYHMQDCIDNCGRGYSTQGAIKTMFKHLDNFALELDVINKSYSGLTSAPQAPRSNRKPFTEEEITKLWKNINLPDADVVLIFIYTGFRISELLNIKTSDVDLANKTIKGGTKTAAGKDRIVPIHSKIFDLVKRRAEEGNEYLISRNGKKTGVLTYRQSCWHPLMERLGMDHVPHDARHTFRSRLDSAGANKVSIDLMMGHQSAGVGERVYTHKTLEELKEAIEKVI